MGYVGGEWGEDVRSVGGRWVGEMARQERRPGPTLIKSWGPGCYSPHRHGPSKLNRSNRFLASVYYVSSSSL